MCGIAGIYHLDDKPVSHLALKSMSDSLIHRGPDGEGCFMDGAFGMSHRRLSIIDLSEAGKQPIRSHCGRYVLSYNGEIYNYRELRADLKSKGYRFVSKSDTEVVLYAFAEWSRSCVDKFNGMFAFSIWDVQEKSLFLARDRYGIKPLYYFHEDGIFIYASEIKAILASGYYSPDIDQSGLMEYMNFQNFLTDTTLFKRVKLLMPATTLAVNEDGKLISHQYWDFHFTDEVISSENEIVDHLDYLFKKSLSRHLVADVDVNSYLSGGVDSGAITLLAAKQREGMKSFTVGFDMCSVSGEEQAYDEREIAEKMSYLAGTEHYEMVLKSGDIERCMSKLVWHLEEPRVGQCYPNYYAAKLAGAFGKVVLSGVGGDELFGGYPWRYMPAIFDKNLEKFLENYYQYWQRLLTSEQKEKIFSAQNNKFDGKLLFNSIIGKNTDFCSSSFINSALRFEAKSFLHGLLVVEDKMSMAHNLEVRLPMLDNDLVDYAMKIGSKYKVGKVKDGKNIDTLQGKKILRKLFGRYVPGNISHKKQGFSAPDATWFQSMDYVNDILQDKQNPLYSFMDRLTILKMLDQHISGEKNNRLAIWSFLYLSEWLKQFVVCGSRFLKI